MSENWSAMTALGPSAKQIAIGQDNSSKIALFYVGQDNSINWCVRTAASVMTAAPLGGQAKQVAVVQHVGGWNELFYIAMDGSLWHNWQNAAFFWVGGFPMPLHSSAIAQIAAGLCSDGTADLVCIGADNQLYHCRQLAPSAQAFPSLLTPLGASAKKIALVLDIHGGLHLLYIGMDDALYHCWQSGRDWGAAEKIASSVSSVASVNDANGVMTVFYTGLTAAVYVLPLTPHGWGTATQIGGAYCSPATEVSAVLNTDGTLEAFYHGTGMGIWHSRQKATGDWAAEEELQGSLFPTQLVVGVEPEGYVHAFALGSGGEIEHWLDNESAAYLCGSPPGVPLSGLVGASHIGDVVAVYGVGIDGNLWGRSISALGAVWQKLGTVPAPLAQTGNNSANGVVPVGNDLWLFTLDTSGKICTAIWTPGAWTWAELPGQPPTYAGITAIHGAIATPTVTIYATDTSGASWEIRWMADSSTGLGWKWDSAASPAFGSTATVAWTHELDPMHWGILGDYIAYYITGGQEGSNDGTVYSTTTQWITLSLSLQSGNIICSIAAGTV